MGKRASVGEAKGEERIAEVLFVAVL